MSKILFSPVGGTDPMPATRDENGNRATTDGSLIHIARFYRPDKIILYMSKEIYENEEKDNRYTYCLRQLLDPQNEKEPDIKIISKENLSEVQDFNYFYKDFGELLAEIIQNKKEEDIIYLNISSGTPAMKSALVVLKHLWQADCELIQVATPARRMNNRNRIDEYDPEVWWAANKDENAARAGEPFENRCTEVKCSNLLELQNEEIIKRLVRRCDYQAALVIAKTMKRRSKRYLPLLEFAKKRLQLDFDGMNRAYLEFSPEEREICSLPYEVKKKPHEKQIYLEYIQNLTIKYETGHYADFIRAISPMIEGIFLIILRDKFGIDIRRDFCYEDPGNNGKYCWDKAKLTRKTKPAEMINSILSKGRNFNYNSPISSADLIRIIRRISKKNRDDMKSLQHLRDVELKLRNEAAHQIVSVNEITIKNKTELTPTQIIKKMKQGLLYAGCVENKEDFKSLQNMNEKIIDLMVAAFPKDGIVEGTQVS